MSETRNVSWFERLLSRTAVYGVGVVVARLGSLALLPVLWLKLSPADFGIIGLVQFVLMFLAPVFGLGLADAVQRQYYEWTDDERPKMIGSIWLSILFFNLIFCAFLALFGAPLFTFILSQLPFSPFLQIALATIFFNNLSILPLVILRTTEQAGKFTLITLGIFFTQTSFIMGALFFTDTGVLGYLLSICLSYALWGIYFVYFMLSCTKFDIFTTNITGSYKYSLPLIPSGVVENASNLLDRYFLDKWVSISTLGIYGIGFQLGGIVTSFNQILKTSYIPFIIRSLSDGKQTSQLLSNVSLYYIAFMGFVSLGALAFLPEFIVFFAPVQFHFVMELLPYFVFSNYIHSYGTAMGRGIDLSKKTHYAFLISVLTITLTFFLLSIFVPKYGVYGALYALLASVSFRTLVTIVCSVIFFPRKIFWKNLFALNGVLLASYLISLQFTSDSLVISLFVDLAILVIVAILLCFCVAPSFAFWISLYKGRFGYVKK